MSDRESNLQTANLLLNASFEEADFVDELVDCYSVFRGTAKRSSQPDHGTYALTLSPAASLYFGNSKPSICVSEIKTLHGHVAVLGTGNLRFQMDFFNRDLEPLPSQGKQFSANEDAHYTSHHFTIAVPQNAEFAAVSWHSPQDSEVTFDTVYLGKEAYSEEKMPDSMPEVERYFPQPADVDKLPASTIGDFQGIPTWHIDSQPIVNSLYTVERMRPNSSPDSFKYHKNVIAEGRFPIYIVGSPISINEEGFRGINAALNNLDFQVRLVLSECPDARFLVWCHQYVSDEFIRNYPDELAKVEDDSCGFKRPLKFGYSYGSEIWGRLVAQGLEKFISRASNESYGDRIVGIIPGFGQYGENNWGHIDGKYYTSPHDFSPAMKNFFRKWLFREYQADVEAFCKAWQRPKFNFANAQVPTQLQRVPRLKGAFLDPEKQRQIIDYARCDSYSILHRVLQQCKAVKEVSQGKLFTMSEIGYLALRYNHREMQAALRSPYLDAWGPAPGYTNREPGDDIPDNAPVASLKHAGKVWMFQADVRSHLAGSHLKRFGDTANAAESVAVYLREMGHYMTGGAIPYHWIFNTWYRDEKIMSVVRKFDFLMQLSSHFPRHSTAEVALVLDPLSLSTGIEFNYNRRPETAADQISRNRSLEWHKIGAPYDYWVLDDLLDSKQLQQYKVVIMGAICTLTGKQRQLIQERLHRDGRTVIWMYAPGIIRAEGTQLSWDLRNMDISGFSLAEDSGSRPLAINLTEQACLRYNIQSEELPLGNFKSLIYGGFGSNPENPKPLPPEKMAARYHVEGLQGIEILGVYADQPLVAAAQRKFADYTSIFWGNTALDNLFLRPVLRETGVHLYSDRPAVVYANQHFLMLHSSQDGEHQIELPQTAEIVYDLYEEKLLASRTSRLRVQMEASRTLLLYYGPEAELEQARLQINKNREEREKANQGMLSQHVFDPVLRNLSRPAVPDQSYSPDSQGFIRHWLFAGPFPNHGDNEGFEQDFLNTEEEVRPQTGQNFTATFAANPKTEKLAAQSWFKGHAGEKTLNFSWKALEFSEGITTNIAQQMDLPFKDRIVYYCVCYVKSPVSQEALLSTGSDDGHKTFLNGQLAMSINVRSRSLIPDSEQAPVQLNEGTNTLLLKVIQGVGGLGHAVRFLDPDSKKPITDLQVTLQP